MTSHFTKTYFWPHICFAFKQLHLCWTGFLPGLLHHYEMTQVRGVDGQRNWGLTLQMDDFYVFSCLRGKYNIGQNLRNRNKHHPVKKKKKRIGKENTEYKWYCKKKESLCTQNSYSPLLTLLRRWKPLSSHSQASHPLSCLNVLHVPCCNDKPHNQFKALKTKKKKTHVS